MGEKEFQDIQRLLEENEICISRLENEVKKIKEKLRFIMEDFTEDLEIPQEQKGRLN